MKYIDMISRLGIGSAHPGGFGATLAQLESHPLEAGSRVLEVGCGTGRTACHLAALGHRVTAVDAHARMLAKAKLRAEAMGVPVEFALGDACRLPYANGTFDVVFVESATNFADAGGALAEYKRVLRPGGVLYDRELALSHPLDGERLERVTAFFGIPQLWTAARWLEQLRQAQFAAAELLETNPYYENAAEERQRYRDPFEIIDEGTFLDVGMWQLTAEYADLIAEYRTDLAYVLLRATR